MYKFFKLFKNQFDCIFTDVVTVSSEINPLKLVGDKSVSTRFGNFNLLLKYMRLSGIFLYR